jgi:hypothetical protein
MTRELYRKNSPGERSGSLFAQRMSWSRLSEQLFRVVDSTTQRIIE